MATEKYFIEDTPYFGDYDELNIEEMSKDEFTESLNYNIEVAYEYGDGDDCKDLDAYRNKIWLMLEMYGNVEVNGFTYSVVIND